jgi:signal transduction histidine kinase/CheY-like chemotaxis protein
VIRSKIFYKSMLVVSVIILAYTIALLLVVLPRVEESTQSLETKNGKEVLNKVVLITKNMQRNLENFEKNALQYHKKELKNLTDSFWSIVQTKYEQSRPENIGSILQDRGEEFKNNLTLFYDKNKNTMSTEELKQAIIHYVNIYRYFQGSGYFFIHAQTTVVEHPIYPDFKGKDLAQLQDENGIYLVQEFQTLSRENGSGTLYYRWKHPQSKVIEDKVAYVFTFEPFDWIIGTTAVINELQEMLKDDVIYLANKIRYGQDNYFFINGYDSKVIAHPYIKKGTDFSTRQDSHGNLIVPPMIKVARENGEGFTRYWWKKDPAKNETFEKLTFSKDFPNWQMVINTGTYIDTIQKEIGKRKTELIMRLRHIMEKTTIGKSGYLFIVDDQARMIIHRNQYMEGKDTISMKNPSSGNYIFDDLKDAAEAGQPLYFKWDRPTDKGNYIYDKIAWVEYIPELQWYITSSAYTQELQETSEQLKNRILFLGLSILLFSFLISFIFFKNLLKPISTLSALASRVTKGDYSARSQLKSNDEIGILSDEFNIMVDTIEDNIHNLDQNVAEKTKEIEEQNMLFETLFYESSDGMLLIHDGLFVDCNRSAYQMLQYTNKNELIALHPAEISPAVQLDGRDSHEKADKMMKTALKNGSSRFEWVHLCKNGSETIFEIVLTRVTIRDDMLIHVVWRDINEKKAADKRLEKALAEFSAVMDTIDYGVLFMDDKLQARIVNQAFRDIWKIPDDFVAGHPTMRELMEFNRHDNLYNVADDEFDHYMDEREADVRNGAIPPTPFKRKDGMILQYQCVVLPDGGRMLTYFDITELKNTQDQLARAQKMEVIGTMAGGVAHDLNNILSGIVSYPELLLLHLPESSNLRKPIEAIQESGKRAATVVADLLTVARGVASTREAHDINILIREYLHSPEYEKLQSLHPDVLCTKHLDAPLSVISCSPVHIKKTVMNLMANAIEAIGTIGDVHITTANLKINSGEGGVKNIPVGHYVVLSIQDNGPGISDEDVSHIFEPFYTKKVMGRSGTGLGLTVVWNTVEDHGGQIRVESSAKGTCFTLYFPVSTETLSHHEEKQKDKMDTTRGEHILVVDDEAQLRDIASQILTSLGYKVNSVSSGEKALTFIQENPVDLLVIDMLMEPGINGRQTYEKILELYPEQKAVITSGFSENDDIKATLKLGAHGFIKKPYSISQLGKVVKEALGA